MLETNIMYCIIFQSIQKKIIKCNTFICDIICVWKIKTNNSMISIQSTIVFIKGYVIPVPSNHMY